MPKKIIEPHLCLNRGKERWKVWIPEGLRGKWGRTRRFFKTERQALDFCYELSEEREGWGGRLLSLSSEDRGRVVRALDLAGSPGKLEEAVEAWMKRKAVLAKPLAKAIDECVEAKRKAGRSWQYVENMEVGLWQFAAGRENMPTSEVTTDQVERFLTGNGWSAATQITYARRLETFFTWAARKGYSASNPMVGVERPSVVEGPVIILPVRDCRRLLETCRRVDLDLLPYFAICLFAGVRPEETKRLGQENIKEGYIEIQARRAKTRRRRLVEIHPTLRAWLDLGGQIGWSNWRRRWREVRQATAVGEQGPEMPVEWSSDVLRHSFASYAYPIKGAVWTAAECGHSERTLFNRYRELVRKDEAEKFWALTPAHTGPGKTDAGAGKIDTQT